METEIVYLKIDRHIEVENPVVTLGQLGIVYCTDSKLEKQLENMTVFSFEEKDNHTQQTASVLVLIKKIHDYLKNNNLYIQNLGDGEFIMSLRFTKEKKYKATKLKVAFVAIVIFFGSVFSVMAYNEDVGVTGIFEKISSMMGGGHIGFTLMTISYGVGIGLGVIIFFNHFGRKKMTKDPTPMEVEMEKYETDIDQTFIKENARKGRDLHG